MACSILLELGYFLGIKKSSLIPAIKVKYLGYFSESDKQAFTLPPEKVLKFAALRDSILGKKTVSLKTLQNVFWENYLFFPPRPWSETLH